MKFLISILIILFLFLSCSPQKKSESHFDSTFNEQPKIGSSPFIAIDHIPIVVNDLEKIKIILKEQLHFTIKEGKLHEGIKNCFVKFQNGTYLEFIEPIDSLENIGKYYSDFLKIRQGGTSLAISVSNAETIKKTLAEKNIQFTMDSNRVWQTIEPQNADLFFIEYENKNWSENATNTAHSNTATSLNATYILTDNSANKTEKYRTTFGFSEAENGMFLGIPYQQIKIRHNSLNILDRTKSNNINRLLNNQNLQGICGFEIKVNSLKTFNSLISKKLNIKHENDRTTIFFKEYNLFLTFTE